MNSSLTLTRTLVFLGVILSCLFFATSSNANGNEGCYSDPRGDGTLICPEEPDDRPPLLSRLATDNALSFFYYSMGRNSDGTPYSGNTDTCLTCDFITHFTTAMSKFSAQIFVFLQEFFVVLAPILMSIWIAYRVIALHIRGGAGGPKFYKDVVQKSALFVLVWIFLFNGFQIQGPAQPGSVGTYNAGPAWQLAGPKLLEYSFGLNEDVRTKTMESLLEMGVSTRDTSPFECTRLDARITALVNNPTLNPSISQITKTSCVIERMHSIGIGTGVALFTSSFIQVELFNPLSLFASIMKVVWGVILITVFGLSAVWLTFLLLDVVTKALIVSAFLPVFGLTILFESTRNITKNALTQLLGVPVVAFALGLTTLLGFFMIFGVVDVYNNTYQLMGSEGIFNRPNLQPIADGDSIAQFAEFISRTQQPISDPDTIPTYLASPWLHYLMLVGIGLFALGKKIVSIITKIMGVENGTAMADNAKSMALKGAMVAGGAGLITAKSGFMAGKIGAKVGTGTASFAGGAATRVGQTQTVQNAVNSARSWSSGHMSRGSRGRSSEEDQ